MLQVTHWYIINFVEITYVSGIFVLEHFFMMFLPLFSSISTSKTFVIGGKKKKKVGGEALDNGCFELSVLR